MGRRIVRNILASAEQWQAASCSCVAARVAVLHRLSEKKVGEAEWVSLSSDSVTAPRRHEWSASLRYRVINPTLEISSQSLTHFSLVSIASAPSAASGPERAHSDSAQCMPGSLPENV